MGNDILEPCPFCGRAASADGHIKYNRALDDTWWEDGSDITEAFYVNCMSCGAVSRSGIVGGYQTRAEAIERWNTRSAPLAAENERLRDECEKLAACLETLTTFAERAIEALRLTDTNGIIAASRTALAHKETV